MADLELLKDIPGYQAILRAILKTQIQHLVEQLAEQTGEESILLTASVSDGTLCHLGSTSGRDFLQGHDDLKSKFLGFCLKRHHTREEVEVEPTPSTAPPHIVDAPHKHSSPKPQLLAPHKPYQRQVAPPKMPKSRLHVQHSRTDGQQVSMFLAGANGELGTPPVSEINPAGAIGGDDFAEGDSEHSAVHTSTSQVPYGQLDECGLPSNVADDSRQCPSVSDPAVDSADSMYRDVKVKREPQTGNADEQEDAEIMYRMGAEGGQMGGDWDTDVSRLGPASDSGGGLEMDNTQAPYTGAPVFTASCKGERFVVYDTDKDCEFTKRRETRTETTATIRKTRSDMRQFQAYMSWNNERRDIEQLPPDVMDLHFGNFLLCARKAKNGQTKTDEYEASTLQSFMCSLDRYLGERGWPRGVLRSTMFPHSNACLAAKVNELKTKRIAGEKTSDQQRTFTDSDIDKLFERGIMGVDSPGALINFLHLTFSMELGIRPGKQQRRLHWGDIEVGTSRDGRQFLQYTKPRSRKRGKALRFQAKSWSSIYKDKCPVNAYRIYASKRTPQMLLPESPFFLLPNLRQKEGWHAWYKSIPMGSNSLYTLTAKMWQQLTSDSRDSPASSTDTAATE